MKQPSVFKSSAFRTDNLDHAIEHLRSRFADHNRVLIDRSAFGWGYRSYASENVNIYRVTSTGKDVVNAAVPPSVAIFHFPLAQGKEYRVGRRTFTIRPGQGIMLPPQHTYSVRSHGGTAVSIVVGLDALAEKVEQLCPGHGRHLGLTVTELRLTEQSRASILASIARIKNLSGEQPSEFIQQLSLRMEDEVIYRLAAEVARHRGVVTMSPGRRLQIEQLEKWIQDNLGEAIDLAQLTRVTGVGARALAKTTRAARGLSPMELVTAARLTHARNLLRQGATRSITWVATNSGFNHLGRFAAAYRDAYGELPSATLARRRLDSRVKVKGI